MKTIEIFTCAQKLPPPDVRVWRVVNGAIFSDVAVIVVVVTPEELEFYEPGVVTTMQWDSYDMWFTDEWFIL